MKKEDKQQQAIVQQKTQESIQKQQTILLMTQCFIGSVHYDVGMRDLRKISKFFSFFFKFWHNVMKINFWCQIQIWLFWFFHLTLTFSTLYEKPFVNNLFIKKVLQSFLKTEVSKFWFFFIEKLFHRLESWKL